MIAVLPKKSFLEDLVFIFQSDKTSGVPDISQGLRITLKYNGTDVDDGTMPIDDVVASLQGFASAYSKVAGTRDSRSEHQLRISAISHSSVALQILAWATENPKNMMTVATVAGGAVAWTVRTIIKIIEVRRATKGKEPEIKIDGDGNTVVSNTGDGTVIVLPPDMRGITQLMKAIEGDIAKIARPLEKGKVESATITATDPAGHLIAGSTITSDEKAFFDTEEPAVVSSRPLLLEGRIVSINNESLRGLFRMQNGRGVQYRFIGNDLRGVTDAIARRAMVRVECQAFFDAELEPIRLDIKSVSVLQPSLFSEISPEQESDSPERPY